MNFRRLLPDITSGLTVSFAALSLGAAFGVMSGRGAFAGMIGAAIIPIITSIFGGTRIQASGPTAPMTAISALVVAYAYDNFPVKEVAEQFITLVFIMTGLILIVASLARLGTLISLVPNVVVLGFMNGIAVLIWYDQLVKIFALKGKEFMQGGIWLNLAIALSTFLLIYLIVHTVKKAALRPQVRSLLSGVLLSIVIMTTFSVLFNIQVEQVQLGGTVESVAAFGSMLASYFPNEIIQAEYMLMAVPFALQLTLLAYLDSLLTALVVDKMTREKSNLNRELFAQGMGNALSGALQGIPGAQATIRSVLLIKEGAQTRLAGVLLGVFVMVCILLLKDLLALVPAAVFIGVLFKAGLDVSDKDFPRTYLLKRWFRYPMRNIQLFFIAYTTLVTVLIDLNIAVVSGTLLFYTAKHLWGIADVESDFQEISEQERKLVTG